MFEAEFLNMERMIIWNNINLEQPLKDKKSNLDNKSIAAS